MSSIYGLQFLRPYLFRDLPVAKKSVYTRFYNTTAQFAAQAAYSVKGVEDVDTSPGKSYLERTCPEKSSSALPQENRSPGRISHGPTAKGRKAVAERIEELKVANALVYPRIQRINSALNFKEYTKRYGKLKAGEKLDEAVTVRGRVLSVRISGKKLVFLDLVQDDRVLQVICSFGSVAASGDLAPFRTFSHLVRRGDIVSVVGNPIGKDTGPLSIKATALPQILSPALPLLPTVLGDRETRIRNRHVDLLVNKNVADTLRVRSHIIQYVREFLLRDDFLEVQTPIMVGIANGAAARPFTTAATEFLDKKLALRIAPEIWLKRLVLGGFDRVFEIGPAFRNEGLDATHNPEFTTCEFYKSYADLEDLMQMTEDMISGLADHVNSLRDGPLKTLPAIDARLLSTPFRRIEFIPAVEAGWREMLPDLAAQDATEKVLALFEKHGLHVPASPTLPHLLDKLSTIYIEPRCQQPTYIIHHPACMAPLSKSFRDSATNQMVSARAELFIQQKEIANMYEEENSPFEQRQKFVQQTLLKDEESDAEVDESYLEALEWGLPPTGGWGCGIDRICMLLSGSTRISDVLAFGSLRNVVNLGNRVEKESENTEG